MRLSGAQSAWFVLIIQPKKRHTNYPAQGCNIMSWLDTKLQLSKDKTVATRPGRLTTECSPENTHRFPGCRRGSNDCGREKRWIFVPCSPRSPKSRKIRCPVVSNTAPPPGEAQCHGRLGAQLCQTQLHHLVKHNVTEDSVPSCVKHSSTTW